MLIAAKRKHGLKPLREFKLKTKTSKTKARKTQKKFNAEEPAKEIGILEVRSETSAKGAKPVKQKLIAIEKNGKLISLA